MQTPEDLEHEIEQRKNVEAKLHDAYGQLELRVVERTAALEKSAAKLRDSEASFRTLTEAMPQIVWTSRPDGYLDYYNQHWVDYTGMTVEQTQGWGWEPVIHPEDLPNCVERWTHALQSGDLYEVEYRFKRASDGAYRWHLGRATPLRNEAGEIVKWFGTCTDIEDQKQAEAKLRQSRDSLELAVAERTRALQHELEERKKIETELRVTKEAVEEVARTNQNMMEYSRDVICSIDEAGRFVKVSPASVKVWGYSPEELVGRPFIELIHPDDASKTSEADAGIAKGNAVDNFENRYVCRDGSTVYMLWSAVWVEAEKTTFCVARDITERKHSEAALKQSEQRFRSVVEKVECLIIHDEKGQVVDVNQSACDSLGYTRDEMLQLTVPQFELNYQEKAIQKLWDDMATGAKDRFTVDGIHLRKDGSTFPVEVRVGLIKNNSSTLMVAVARDVSERKQAEEELRAAKEAAEAASLAKSQFLANMSHEIRTPMNGVLGPIGLLLDSKMSEPQRELTEIARTSAESLLGIINDILDLSKIEAGRLDIEPIPFNLLTAVEETASMMAARADEKNLDLIVRYPADVPRHVVGDPGRVRQVLANLIGNAVKFTSSGHVLVNVGTLDIGSPPGEVALRISVEDSGIGIEPDRIDQVFGRFNQADTSTTRRYGGTGLGLAISKQLVELMGGEIGASSTRYEGSTFWFTLHLPHSSDVQLSSLDTDLSDVRVLVVDDNAVNRRVLHEQLLGWNARNETCESADEAMVALRQARNEGDAFDIAILDHQMPDKDGEELGKMIKNDRELRDTVLVMLTSLGHKGDATRLKAAGFAAYLIKPARQLEMLDALLAAWAARNRARGIAGANDVVAGSDSVSDITTAASESWKGVRVLVVEDNIVNQKVAGMILRSFGCHIEVTANGLEALHMIETLPFDIVFMDCEMPEMDGYEATAKIRARDDDKRRLPIIAVTAKATQGDRGRCLEAGMDDYISKPVRSEDFQAALSRWIPKRETEENAANKNAENTNASDATSSENALATPALDTAVVANLRALAQSTDATLLQQIFEAFVGDGEQRIAVMQHALREDDADSLRRAAHTLKGASANIGARSMADIAQQLQAWGESQAHGESQGDTSSTRDMQSAAAPLVEQLASEFARVKNQIAAELKSL